jgi:hypothetical protein
MKASAQRYGGHETAVSSTLVIDSCDDYKVLYLNTSSDSLSNVSYSSAIAQTTTPFVV